jgi:hypothetical protein
MVLYPVLDRSVVLLERSLVAAADFVPGTVSPPAPNPWVYYSGIALLAFARARRRRKFAGWFLIGVSFVVDVIVRQLF